MAVLVQSKLVQDRLGGLRWETDSAVGVSQLEQLSEVVVLLGQDVHLSLETYNQSLARILKEKKQTNRK